jgi:hypothetical protein
MDSNIDYTKQWLALDYEEPMASSSFLPPPSADYVRAYHVLCSKWALEDIERARLKVSRFSEVNDPFELLGLNCHNKTVRKITKRFAEDQDQQRGLLSFSENWNSPALWSHYAAKHKGMCLGFDVRRRMVEKVEYVDDRLRDLLDEEEPEIPDDIRAQLCRTKSSEWSYERELRVLVELKDGTFESPHYFRPFSDDMRLAEVILGPKCDRSLSEVGALVRRVNVDAAVFEARLALRSFRVVLQGRTRPVVRSA